MSGLLLILKFGDGFDCRNTEGERTEGFSEQSVLLYLPLAVNKGTWENLELGDLDQSF